MTTKGAITAEMARELFNPAMRIVHAINMQDSKHWGPAEQAFHLATIPELVSQLAATIGYTITRREE